MYSNLDISYSIFCSILLWLVDLDLFFGFLPREDEKGITKIIKRELNSIGGGNSKIFYFSPKFGELIQFDEHIFQMGI